MGVGISASFPAVCLLLTVTIERAMTEPVSSFRSHSNLVAFQWADNVYILFFPPISIGGITGHSASHNW